MRKSALLAFGLVVAMIVALGLIVLSTAGEPNAIKYYHNPYHFIIRQGIFVVLGVGLATAVAFFDYHHWRDHKELTYAFAVVVFVLLCAVFLFPETKGSQRWIPIGPVNLQPGELAKLATVLLLSVWLDRIGWKVELFKDGLLFPSLLLGILVAPVVKEPDYGSAAVILAAGFLIMFVAGVRIRHIAPPILLAALAIGLFVYFNPNRMARILAFLEPSTGGADGAGYQAYNSLVAIANGGLWGVGLGQSMQKQFYLPEAHTDFILAIGAEEFGLLFSIGVLILFAAFFGLSVYIARKASDRFGRFLVLGMSFIVFFQAMANVGVVCKAFPTKGVALPFFSYGGTNMLCAFFAVGMILSVGLHSSGDNKRRV